MKVFIFDRISQVSGNWHPEGGLVIIAKDIEHAKKLIEGDKNIKPCKKEWEFVETYDLKDKKATPKFWVMPDAGCC